MTRGGIPQGTGLLFAGRMYVPNAAHQEPDPLLSPPRNQNRRGRSEQRHLPGTSCRKTWLQRVTEESTGDRSVVPTNLGVASVSVSLSVTCTRTQSPRGRRSLPQEVLRHRLRGGGSVLAAQPPSVHAQVRELHLIHRDGVVLGLAVGSCDGARWARWWPERGEREGGVLQSCFIKN